MKYMNKIRLATSGHSFHEGAYQKPMVCPYCGIHTDSILKDGSELPYEQGKKAIAIAFECTSCQKNFITVYIKDGDSLILNSIVPIMDDEPLHAGLAKISPRFINIHKQAFRAEARGDEEIAAIGYRTALEMLTKDYAVEEKAAPLADVASLSLGKMIEKYFSDNLLNAADVVRIIGNDFTHYVNGHPEVGFEEFKHYYNLSLRFLGIEYDMNHPPVVR